MIRDDFIFGEKTLDNIAYSTYGMSHSDAINLQVCISCGSEAVSFRDSLSAREYEISGFCQICQDEFFAEGHEEEDVLEDERDVF